MTDPCCPPPDDIDPLLDRAQYLVDAGRAERAAGNEARETNRRCSNTHHTFAGYQNGQPLIQPLGGKPYAARGRLITNASVARGTPVQFRGCGTQIGQMTRRRGGVEEPATPDQVFWFVYGVGGATFVNSAIALGQTSIQIDYLNGDGCGGGVNLTQTGIAVGILDLQSDRTISFSFQGNAKKILTAGALNNFFEVLAYRIDQPGTPEISGIETYRAFVDPTTSNPNWYLRSALTSRMSAVRVANPAIVPPSDTPIVDLSAAPNPATNVTNDIGSGFYVLKTVFDQFGQSNPCTPVFIDTIPDPANAGQNLIRNALSSVPTLQNAIFPASYTLIPGKYLIYFSSDVPVNSLLVTYNASNFMRMSVTGL